MTLFFQLLYYLLRCVSQFKSNTLSDASYIKRAQKNCDHYQVINKFGAKNMNIEN